MVYEIQPLDDPRWGQFIARHPCSSVFHTSGFLKALQTTYGYEPVVFTTSAPGADLQNGLVSCRVNSWVTGHRLVSVPFADHCDLLVDDAADQHAILSALEQTLRRNKLRYFELRPRSPLAATNSLFQSNMAYVWHQLDLSSDLNRLFGSFHKDSTQRKIRRAEREGLIYEEGQSEVLVEHFYRLLLLTRRRHRLPPQPNKWFYNLIACLGDDLKIRVAFKGTQAVAAILTLRHKDTLMYKYGCSDTKFNNLGGTHLLFWRSIQEAKRDGLRTFDFGRAEPSHAGLIAFKGHWGTTYSILKYSRFAPLAHSRENYQYGEGEWKERAAKLLIAHMPDRILCTAGNLLYRHIG